MGVKSQERCMGCMKLLNWDGRCPNCGFERNKYLSDVHYLPLGTFLKNGDYMVGRVLGEGGFGITYIGFDLNLLCSIAIKEYYPTGLVGRNVSEGDFIPHIYGEEGRKDFKKGLDAFLKEARILAKFSGLEGIVNVRNLFQENGTAYIVMEYVDGISVKNYVRKYGKIKPDLVLEMMEQPMRALHAVHEEQLVHRDVSADNFMIGQDGKVTLIDFGAARYSNALDDKTRTSICKQGFSALEQYSGEGKQGPWTDVYSICATMYYMMTGIVPKNSTERIVDDMVVPLEQMQEISLDIEKKRAVMAGMAVRSSDRFQNMGVLYHAIYGRPLENSMGRHKFLSGENVKADTAEKKEFPQSLVSLTRLKREISQAATNRKSRGRKKRIGRITGGVAAAILLVLLLWNLRGYVGFGEKNDVNLYRESNQVQPVGAEPTDTPSPTDVPPPLETPDTSPKQVSATASVSEKTAGKTTKEPKILVTKKPVVNSKKKNKEKATPKPTLKPTPKPTVTATPVPQKQENSTAKKKTEDDNLAGDLDDILY